MTSTPDKPSTRDTQGKQSMQQDARLTCRTALDEQIECPSCRSHMHLWAGFYRCRNCGYKESCCF